MKGEVVTFEAQVRGRGATVALFDPARHESSSFVSAERRLAVSSPTTKPRSVSSARCASGSPSAGLGIVVCGYATVEIETPRSLREGICS